MAERQATTGRKVTARSVADDLGIPETSFSRYLSKKNPPPDKVTTPMAKYFGVTRGWLRYGDDPKRWPISIQNHPPIVVEDEGGENLEPPGSPGSGGQAASGQQGKPRRVR